MVRTAPGEHWSAFVFVFVFTAILYFNFAWFREQLCLIICPYGRLQSVLIDDHSLVIGYDEQRGEPRAKAGTPDAGACVDCNRCVQVCPTGIDIRQGLQIECIGCAACIDACDTVMDKLHRPRGLVRYDSQAGLTGAKTRWLRPRTLVYAVLMLARAGVRNPCLVRLVHTAAAPARVLLTLVSPGHAVRQTGFTETVEVAPLAEQVQPLVLRVARADYAGRFTVTVQVTDEAGTFTL